MTVFAGVGFCEKHGLVVCEECSFDGRPATIGQAPTLNKEDFCTFDNYSMGASIRNQIRGLAAQGSFERRPDLYEKAKAEWKRSYQDPNLTKQHDLTKTGHYLERGGDD